MLTTRYHEHDVEDDVAECEETFEEKCEDVTQGYTTEQVVECISTLIIVHLFLKIGQIILFLTKFETSREYFQFQKCSKWPVNKCSLSRKPVKKFSPETECKKVPFELCGPGACPVEQGPEECQDRVETVSGFLLSIQLIIIIIISKNL